MFRNWDLISNVKRHVGLRLSASVFAGCCFTAFICSSSGASKPFTSNPFSRCVTICLNVPFSKWAWFIDFFRCDVVLAYMNCSMMTWAAIPNASSASFWSSSRKSTNFCFAGLKTNFWNLCFAVAIDWGFTYFLRKTARVSPKVSRVRLLLFWKVCSASPSWENGNSWFCHLQSADYGFWGSFGKDFQATQTSQICRQALTSLWWAVLAIWKFCWCYYESLQNWCCFPTNEVPKKIWSASIAAGVFSLRISGWLLEWFIFCLPDNLLGEQYVTSSWTPVTLSCHLLGQSFASSVCVRCLLQDEGHSGSRPYSFLGLCQMRSGRLQSGSRVALN